MDIKRAFIDVETTGLNWDSGIHQLALIIDINGQPVHEQTWEICPDPRCKIEDKALEVSGKSRAVMASSMPEANFFREFQVVLSKFITCKYDRQDKLHFTAYNAQFDDSRLRDLFRRQNDRYYGSWFWNPYDCVMIHAGRHLRPIRHQMLDFKLGTVCTAMGLIWDNAEAHDALYDIRMTRELHRALEAKHGN
jgi:DNA polymerase III alpha subunit (gram-positive type)